MRITTTLAMATVLGTLLLSQLGFSQEPEVPAVEKAAAAETSVISEISSASLETRKLDLGSLSSVEEFTNG